MGCPDRHMRRHSFPLRDKAHTGIVQNRVYLGHGEGRQRKGERERDRRARQREEERSTRNPLRERG